MSAYHAFFFPQPSIDKINFSFQHLYLESRLVVKARWKIQLNFPCKTQLNVVSLVPLAIPLWQHFAIIHYPNRREVFNLINIWYIGNKLMKHVECSLLLLWIYEPALSPVTVGTAKMKNITWHAKKTSIACKTLQKCIKIFQLFLSAFLVFYRLVIFVDWMQTCGLLGL